MRFAIVNKEGSFSDRWIDYCQRHSIPFKEVNPYASDIINQVSDCDVFMWHFSHIDYRDSLFAKQLIVSLESKGIKCFPNVNTSWHFDDKVAQKYLLESCGAPLVSSYVFYSRQDAYKWISSTTFPKVFKLRGGAGSSNVKLAHSAKEARKLVNIVFGNGFSQVRSSEDIKERVRKWRDGKTNFKNVLKGFARIIVPTEFSRMHGAEKGYAYFQDFIPNNDYDIRVIVIGDKAFYIKRLVRKGDFRASGSGAFIYIKDQYTEPCVQVAFNVSRLLNTQCTAFDFVISEGRPLIVEISFGFAMHAYDDCEGYYTRDMQYHPGSFIPQHWMIEDLIR